MSKTRSQIIRLAYANPELRRDLLPLLKEGATEMQSRFPSHAVMELGKLYDELSKYHRRVSRDRDPALAEHKKLMNNTMDTFVSLLAKLKRSEESLYVGRFASAQDWKVEFPSHSVRDRVDTLYDVFTNYERLLQRSKDPVLKDHKKLFNETLGTYVTFSARLKNAELALYRM